MRHAAARLLRGSVLLLALGLSPRAHAAEPAAPGSAQTLTAAEQRRLLNGAMVSRAMRFDQDGGHYVGGVSYQVADAAPELVLAALSDVANWPDALPRTKSAR